MFFRFVYILFPVFWLIISDWLIHHFSLKSLSSSVSWFSSFRSPMVWTRFFRCWWIHGTKEYHRVTWLPSIQLTTIVDLLPKSDHFSVHGIGIKWSVQGSSSISSGFNGKCIKFKCIKFKCIKFKCIKFKCIKFKCIKSILWTTTAGMWITWPRHRHPFSLDLVTSVIRYSNRPNHFKSTCTQ